MPGTGVVGASYGDLLMTSLVVLGGVCIAAFVVVRVVGRFLSTGRAHGAHLMGVVARLSLEPRRSLYVVEVAGKTLLVGTSEMGLSVLSELDAGQVRAQVAARPSFGELVRAAWLRRGDVRARGAGAQQVDADAAASLGHKGAGVMSSARDPAGAVAGLQRPGSTQEQMPNPSDAAPPSREGASLPAVGAPGAAEATRGAGAAEDAR